MPNIGLTGNFGMGKSTVLSLFKKLGGYTFDVDDFVSSILERPLIISKIFGLLGEGAVTIEEGKKSVNRKFVANSIFNDDRKKTAIEKIIHPQVLAMMRRETDRINEKDPDAIIFFEVPLLFETGYDRYFDKTVVIYCKREIAIKRLRKKGYSEDEIQGRMQAQMTITKKKKLADFTIDNSLDIAHTEEQTRKIMEKIRKIGI